MPRYSVSRSSTLAAIAILGGLVTACASTTAGMPLSAGTTTSTIPESGGPFSEKPVTSATSKDAVPPGPLKNVEPCTLLSPKEVADLHAGAPRSELVGYVRTCRFTEGKGFVISYGILDEAGLDAISANGPITPVPTVGTHRAVQSVGGLDTCAISIEVTKTSRVDVHGTDDDGDGQRACALAMTLARLVEPKLP
ncbi:DUF3558 family protein [Kibdelosporangium lantanae]|uniref:DUF3558 family protein n=1 Tax=Kibdelosporangium lantanae TaxID=1497396 RepID=A0ABW3MB74_9PSEU